MEKAMDVEIRNKLLEIWEKENWDDKLPSKERKMEVAKEVGLKFEKVSNFVKNHRYKMLKSQKEANKKLVDIKKEEKPEIEVKKEEIPENKEKNVKVRKLVFREILDKKVENGKTYYLIDLTEKQLWKEEFQLIQENKKIEKHIRLFEEKIQKNETNLANITQEIPKEVIVNKIVEKDLSKKVEMDEFEKIKILKEFYQKESELSNDIIEEISKKIGYDSFQIVNWFKKEKEIQEKVKMLNVNNVDIERKRKQENPEENGIKKQKIEKISQINTQIDEKLKQEVDQDNYLEQPVVEVKNLHFKPGILKLNQFETQEWKDLMDFIISQQPKRFGVYIPKEKIMKNVKFNLDSKVYTYDKEIDERISSSKPNTSNVKNVQTTYENSKTEEIPKANISKLENKVIEREEPKIQSNNSMVKEMGSTLIQDPYTMVYYDVPKEYIIPSKPDMRYYKFCGHDFTNKCEKGSKCPKFHVKQSFWDVAHNFKNEKKTTQEKKCSNDEVDVHILPKTIYKGLKHEEILNFYKNFKIKIREDKDDYFVEFESFQMAENAFRALYGSFLHNKIFKARVLMVKKPFQNESKKVENVPVEDSIPKEKKAKINEKENLENELEILKDIEMENFIKNEVRRLRKLAEENLDKTEIKQIEKQVVEKPKKMKKKRKEIPVPVLCVQCLHHQCKKGATSNICSNCQKNNQKSDNQTKKNSKPYSSSIEEFVKFQKSESEAKQRVQPPDPPTSIVEIPIPPKVEDLKPLETKNDEMEEDYDYNDFDNFGSIFSENKEEDQVYCLWESKVLLNILSIDLKNESLGTNLFNEHSKLKALNQDKTFPKNIQDDFIKNLKEISINKMIYFRQLNLAQISNWYAVSICQDYKGNVPNIDPLLSELKKIQGIFVANWKNYDFYFIERNSYKSVKGLEDISFSNYDSTIFICIVVFK